MEMSQVTGIIGITGKACLQPTIMPNPFWWFEWICAKCKTCVPFTIYHPKLAHARRPLKPELLFQTKFPWRKVVQDIQVVCVLGQGQGARNPETHWGSIHPLLQHERKPGDKPASLRTTCNCPGASSSKQTFQFKWLKWVKLLYRGCSGAACSGEIKISRRQENMTWLTVK